MKKAWFSVVGCLLVGGTLVTTIGCGRSCMPQAIAYGVIAEFIAQGIREANSEAQRNALYTPQAYYNVSP